MSGGVSEKEENIVHDITEMLCKFLRAGSACIVVARHAPWRVPLSRCPSTTTTTTTPRIKQRGPKDLFFWPTGYCLLDFASRLSLNWDTFVVIMRLHSWLGTSCLHNNLPMGPSTTWVDSVIFALHTVWRKLKGCASTDDTRMTTSERTSFGDDFSILDAKLQCARMAHHRRW